MHSTVLRFCLCAAKSTCEKTVEFPHTTEGSWGAITTLRPTPNVTLPKFANIRYLMWAPVSESRMRPLGWFQGESEGQKKRICVGFLTARRCPILSQFSPSVGKTRNAYRRSGVIHGSVSCLSVFFCGFEWWNTTAPRILLKCMLISTSAYRYFQPYEYWACQCYLPLPYAHPLESWPLVLGTRRAVLERNLSRLFSLASRRGVL